MRDYRQAIEALESFGNALGFDPDYIRNAIDFTMTMQRAWDEAEPVGQEIILRAAEHMMETEYKPPEVMPDERS